MSDSAAPTLSIRAELDLSAFLTSATQGNAALKTMGETGALAWKQAAQTDAAITGITTFQTRVEALARQLKVLGEQRMDIRVSDNFQQTQEQLSTLERAITALKSQNPLTLQAKADLAAAKADFAQLSQQVQGLKIQAAETE